ncbi:hypothetical protein HRbin27_01800 [bacterium HR27]|nr:hypothetical protein HRbin27_01800 [bacterium HR27]
MDAGLLGLAHAFPGSIDVLLVGASQSADGDPLHLATDPLDRAEVSGRGSREPCLDDVDAQLDQLAGYFDLLVFGHRRAGRLLAVA